MMRIKLRSARTAGLVLSCSAALCAASVGAVARADDIPRPPGAIDGRGWELVSQADKNQGQPTANGLISSNGERAFYQVTAGVPGSTAGTRSTLLATRTATGWRSTNLLPARIDMFGAEYFPSFVSADLSAWIATAEDGLGGGADTPDSKLVKLDDAAHQQLLHTFPVSFGPSGIALVASDDLAHLFANAPEAIDASHQPGTANVYDFGSGTPQLISRMPGTGLAPLCGVDPGAGPGAAFAIDTDMSADQHRAATDGSAVYFTSRGDTAGCADPPNLYRRDVVAGRTALVSGPPVLGDTDLGVDAFVQGAADGSWVVYRTATSLDPSDDGDGLSTDMDLYRWSLGSGNTCLTCGVPQAQVATGFNAGIASLDGSHAYFTAEARLADAPAAGTSSAPNMYVVRGGAVHWITRTTDAGVTRSTSGGGYLTPDGNTLVFRSNDAGLDALSGRANGGQQQYYRYDDRDQSVTCLSCPSGPATAGVPNNLAINNQALRAPIRSASDDGSIVFFPAPDALVSEDVNDSADLYEWHDGTTKLITSGQGRYGDNIPTYLGATANGHDVLFYDSFQLTADSVGDASNKIYDARVDGGFVPPPPPPPACEGEQCKGAPTPPPTLGGVGSELLRGGGDLVPGSSPTLRVTGVDRAARKRIARTGRVALQVRVSEAGKVSATASAKLGKRTRVIARTSKSLPKDGASTLRLKLSRAARKQLSRAGRLALVVGVRYSTTGESRRFVLQLRKAVRHGR